MQTLKTRQEFLRVKKSKIFCASRSLILTKADRVEGAECKKVKIDVDEIRIGYIVTKNIDPKKGKNRRKQGKKAVVRKAVQELMKDVPPSDYVIIGRKDAIDGSFADMKRDLKYCIKKISK